jgi:hypothetical protein
MPMVLKKPQAIQKKKYRQQNKNKINQLGILILPTRKQVSQWLEEAQQLSPIKII